MSSSQSARKEDIPIPDIVIDPSTGNRYIKGKFLGKGGFARCYELTDMTTKKIFAGKIVSKQLLTKPHQKEKVNFIFRYYLKIYLSIILTHFIKSNRYLLEDYLSNKILIDNIFIDETYLKLFYLSRYILNTKIP